MDESIVSIDANVFKYHNVLGELFTFPYTPGSEEQLFDAFNKEFENPHSCFNAYDAAYNKGRVRESIKMRDSARIDHESLQPIGLQQETFKPEAFFQKNKS